MGALLSSHALIEYLRYYKDKYSVMLICIKGDMFLAHFDKYCIYLSLYVPLISGCFWHILVQDRTPGIITKISCVVYIAFIVVLCYIGQ